MTFALLAAKDTKTLVSLAHARLCLGNSALLPNSFSFMLPDVGQEALRPDMKLIEAVISSSSPSPSSSSSVSFDTTTTAVPP